MVRKLSAKWYATLMVALSMMAVLLVMGLMPGIADAQKDTEEGPESTNATDTNATDTDAARVTAAQKKKPELAKGSGTAADGTGTSFSFNVKAEDTKRSTDKAEGKFRLLSGAQFVEGKLRCLRTAKTADGRIAVFAGKVTASNIPAVPVGTFISFDVTDASSGDLLDATAVGSASCFAPTGGTFPVDTGSIVVRLLRG